MNRLRTKTKLGCFDDGNNSAKGFLSDFDETNQAENHIRSLQATRKTYAVPLTPTRERAPSATSKG